MKKYLATVCITLLLSSNTHTTYSMFGKKIATSVAGKAAEALKTANETSLLHKERILADGRFQRTSDQILSEALETVKQAQKTISNAHLEDHDALNDALKKAALLVRKLCKQYVDANASELIMRTQKLRVEIGRAHV